MSAISVDAPALAAHGNSLADGQGGQSCAGCQPAAPDAVSTAVAASFTAWASGLDVLVQCSAAQRATGGAAVVATGQELVTADAEAAEVIASYGRTQMSGGAALMPTGNEMLPAVPAAPGLPAAPTPAAAEMWSQVIHGGPGSAPLRSLARELRSRAAVLAELSGATEQTGRAVDAHWNDGDQPAGRKIVRHALWLSDAADYARGLADSADAAAATVDDAQSATPTPDTFRALRTEYRNALKTYVDSGGTVSQPLSTVSANIAAAQGEALAAQSAYAAAAQVDITTVPSPPSPPPPIVGGPPGGEGGEPGESSVDDAEQKAAHTEQEADSDGSDTPDPEGDGSTGQDEPAESLTPQARTADDPGVDGGGSPPDSAPAPPPVSDAAANAAGEIMGTILGAGTQSAGSAAGMLPSGGGGSPMSALSGLSAMPNLGGFPSPGGSPQDFGLGADDLGMSDDLFDETTPASAGGGAGGGAGGAGLPAGTPASTPAATVSPPTTSPAGGSPTATTPAAGGSRMGGMGMFPPMMGAGNGATASERDKDLNPDRRVVHRDTANTEPVFGELEQLRKRPSRRRSATTQKENSGDDTSSESG